MAISLLSGPRTDLSDGIASLPSNASPLTAYSRYMPHVTNIENLTRFLPGSRRVLALPSRRRPRVVLASRTPGQRWRQSRLFTGSRLSARVWRHVVRLWASLGTMDASMSGGQHWALEGFLSDCALRVQDVVVAVGTPGPAQKLTMQLWDPEGISAYLKFGRSHWAQERLRQERTVLEALPPGCGPAMLKYGRVADGTGLLATAVHGKPHRTQLLPSSQALALLALLEHKKRHPIDTHPWANALRRRNDPNVNAVLGQLEGRDWPIVIHHGDFAPWNVFVTPRQGAVAVDWEYGQVYGFPYMDAAYWVLQVGYLMYHLSPEIAALRATDFLASRLGQGYADAIVRLTALHAHEVAQEEGHLPNEPLQTWRWSVWTNKHGVPPRNEG